VVQWGVVIRPWRIGELAAPVQEVQALLAVPATMVLLIVSGSARPSAVLAGSVLLAAGAVAWGALFERRPWAWPLELTRVIASVLLLHFFSA